MKKDLLSPRISPTLKLRRTDRKKKRKKIRKNIKKKILLRIKIRRTREKRRRKNEFYKNCLEKYQKIALSGFGCDLNNDFNLFGNFVFYIPFSWFFKSNKLF